MNVLTSEQVATLTDRINGRLEEFEVPMARISKGVMRLAHDEIMNFWEENAEKQEKRAVEEALSLTDMLLIGIERGRVQTLRELGQTWRKEDSDKPRQVTNSASPEARKTPVVEPPIDQDQLRADIRDHTAYPSLEPEPNGKDIYEGVHPVAGGPELVKQFGDYPPGDDPRYQAVPVSQVKPVEPPPVPDPLPEPTRVPIMNELPKPGPTNGRGHHAEPSPAAVATLGPEHTVVTPLAEPSPRHQSRAEAHAAITATGLAALRAMATDGIMPQQAVYDATKTDAQPTAMALEHASGMTWGDLAKELGLTMLTPAQRAVDAKRASKASRDPEPVAPDTVVNSRVGLEGETNTPEPVQASTPPRPLIPRIPDVQVVPARVVMAETVVPKPAAPNLVEQMAAARRKLKAEFFEFLHSIAVDNFMPPIDEYDARRPESLPKAQDVMNRLGYSFWGDVAYDAQLKSGKAADIAHRSAKKAVR